MLEAIVEEKNVCLGVIPEERFSGGQSVGSARNCTSGGPFSLRSWLSMVSSSPGPAPAARYPREKDGHVPFALTKVLRKPTNRGRFPGSSGRDVANTDDRAGQSTD